MGKQNLSFCGAISSLSCLLVVLLSVMLSGCGAADKKSGFVILGNKDGYPDKIDESKLQPGLATIYLFNKYRHVDHMHVSGGGIAKFGSPGEPILQLDHRFGDGEVFASGRSQGVGVLLKGYFRLDKPGEYLFQVRSNDGFQLYIDGELVVSDPDVHGDQLSETGKFVAAQAGLFPVAVKYFQRKGTATLELYWQPPGTSSFAIVPREVYLH